MYLTQHSDYALRTLLYLGLQPAGALVPTREISEAYGISLHHLLKVVQTLQEHGFVELVRGRKGGARLSRPPAEINLEAVLRVTEGPIQLIECFNSAHQSCPIIPVCGYKNLTKKALNAFLAVFDGSSLADMLERPAELRRLLAAGPSAAAGNQR